jgi:hypothetical protein
MATSLWALPPMAAISLQLLFYFKNNGLMKRFALKKNLHIKKLQTEKERKISPHENIPASYANKTTRAISGILFTAANIMTG